MNRAELIAAFTHSFDTAHAPLKLLRSGPDRHGDLQITIALPRGAQLTFTCLTVNAGMPVRLTQALRRRAPPNSPHRLAVIAPAWSQRVLAQCVKDDITVFDLDGNRALRSTRTLRLDRLGRPRQAPTPPPADYSGRAAAIALTLLRAPDQIRTQTVIARQAGVNQSWVSRVAQALVERDVIAINRTGRRGVRVLSPAGVLDICQASYSPKILGGQSMCYALSASVERVERRLAEYCVQKNLPHAFTAYSAAARYGPLGPYDRVVMYLDVSPEAQATLARALKLTPARNGALILWKPAMPVVLSAARRVKNTSVVDPVLAYLDMWTLPNRGREHARVFRSFALPEEFA